MKKCRWCEKVKPVEDFYGGRKCKECAKEAARALYRNEPVRHLARERNAPIGQRFCKTCDTVKPLDDFYAKSYRCKDCRRIASHKAYLANPAAARERSRRSRNNRRDELRALRQTPVGQYRQRQQILRRYGMSMEQWQQLYDGQGGKCAICERPEEDTPKGRFHVDHDHACCPGRAGRGKLCGSCNRGLLCANCNQGLGSFRDDPELLRLALQYLTAS